MKYKNICAILLAMVLTISTSFALELKINAWNNGSSYYDLPAKSFVFEITYTPTKDVSQLLDSKSIYYKDYFGTASDELSNMHNSIHIPDFTFPTNGKSVLLDGTITFKVCSAKAETRWSKKPVCSGEWEQVRSIYVKAYSRNDDGDKVTLYYEADNPVGSEEIKDHSYEWKDSLTHETNYISAIKIDTKFGFAPTDKKSFHDRLELDFEWSSK